VVVAGTDYKSSMPLACSDVPRGVTGSKNVDTHGERVELAMRVHPTVHPTFFDLAGDLGWSPQQGSGAKQLVRVSEGGGAKLPEAENLLAFGARWKQQICFIIHILQTP